MLMAPRETIAEQLWLRDEGELAVGMLDADEETHRRVMEVAASPRTGGLFTSRVDALLTLAAIQVLTGEKRKPRRRRPRPEADLEAFWQQVGPDRDRRDPDDPLAGLSGFLPGG